MYIKNTEKLLDSDTVITINYDCTTKLESCGFDGVDFDYDRVHVTVEVDQMITENMALGGLDRSEKAGSITGALLQFPENTDLFNYIDSLEDPSRYSYVTHFCKEDKWVLDPDVVGLDGFLRFLEITRNELKEGVPIKPFLLEITKNLGCDYVVWHNKTLDIGGSGGYAFKEWIIWDKDSLISFLRGGLRGIEQIDLMTQ